MKKNRKLYYETVIFPSLFFSVVTGVCCAAVIFLFKVCSGRLIGYSTGIYDYVRQNPIWLPLLILGALALGILSMLVLKIVPEAKGGGIPTAIAVARGILKGQTVKVGAVVFLSAMITYFAGVPLGNEGPSVLIGLVVGSTVAKIMSKKYPAWSRYVMTGGACAGFGIATGSAAAGVLFSLEENHRKFSPIILIMSSMTVIAGSITTQALCGIFNMDYRLFAFDIFDPMPLKYIYTAFLTGIVAGFFAIGFTKMFSLVKRFIAKYKNKYRYVINIPAVFVITAVVGFFLPYSVSTGHSLADELILGKIALYMMIIYLLTRVILMIFANTLGVTGGLFVPTLAVGAVIGAFCGRVFEYLGIMDSKYYSLVVIFGIASFLAASNRIPITALVFAVDGLGGVKNVLPLFCAVASAYFVVHVASLPSTTEMVVENIRDRIFYKGRVKTIDAYLIVKKSSFAIGKEARDLLFPPSTIVISVNNHKDWDINPSAFLSEGDEVHFRYQTTDPSQTLREIEDIVGKQDKNVVIVEKSEDYSAVIPEF